MKFTVVKVNLKMMLTLRKVFHVSVFGWYAFVVKSLAAKDGEELPPGIFVYGGPWKYLTFLNLVRMLPVQVHQMIEWFIDRTVLER